jgi:hypothetical protein
MRKIPIPIANGSAAPPAGRRQQRWSGFLPPSGSAFYLQQRLQARLDPSNNNHVCLDLQVQLRNDPPSQPIENTLIAWDGNVTGWQKVARIDVYPQAFTSLAQQQFCERLAYNPYQGLKVHAAARRHQPCARRGSPRGAGCPAERQWLEALRCR